MDEDTDLTQAALHFIAESCPDFMLHILEDQRTWCLHLSQETIPFRDIDLDDVLAEAVAFIHAKREQARLN